MEREAEALLKTSTDDMKYKTKANRLHVILEPAVSTDELPLQEETSDETSVASNFSFYYNRKGIECPTDYLIHDEKRKSLPADFNSIQRLGKGPDRNLLLLTKDHPMQVILKPVLSSEGDPVEIETNTKSILSSLISSYCSQKGIKYDSRYTIFDDKKRPLPMYSTISALGIENGQTLLIGKDDSSFNVLKQWPIIVALAAIAIGLVGVLTMSLIYGLKGGEYFDDYGVVMDAGSSKTNTLVYKWRSSKYKGTGRVSQEGSCFSSGGIAEMNPTHLEPVIDCAKNVTSFIAPESLSKTPLYFAATAGMRLLNITNATRVKQILDKLNSELPDTGLDVKAIEIIPGRDEGIYGWITANYLLKTLEAPQKTDPWEPTTSGALDMGGASMQISYAIPDGAIKNESDVKKMKLYGQTFNVFSQSNLCFGRLEAQNRYRALLMINRNGNEVKDPCSPKDYSETVTGGEIFKSICTRYSKSDDPDLKDPSKLEAYFTKEFDIKEKCIWRNHVLAELKRRKHVFNVFNNVTFTYVGTSDPKACNESVSKLLDDNLCKKLQFKECFRKHKDLLDNQEYLAFATFYYTTSFLNITNVTLSEFEAAKDNFCQKDYSEVMRLSKNSTFGTQYCFNAQYIHEVLINGFGFSTNTWKNLRFVGKISGKDVGWALGYMIAATNLIPEKATERLISATSLTVSLVIFICIIIFTALFLLITFRKNTRGSESPC